MNYYSLHESTDSKVIGRKWPQCELFFSPDGYDGEPYSSFTDYFDKLNKDLKIGGAILNSKAKVTDLVSNGGFIDGKIISDKLKNILEASNLKGIAFFPIVLLVNNKASEDFWIIKPYYSDFNFLDIKKCEFRIKKIKDDNIESVIIFNSVEELLRVFNEIRKKNSTLNDYNEVSNLECIKIVFNKDTDLDFFSFCPGKPLSLSLYISDRLKKIIEQENCTGCSFQELNNV